METPSSIRRLTRSQILSSAGSNGIPATRKRDESEKGKMKSVQRQDRSALFDITNDSPIIGLAMGNLATPSSAASKKKALVQSAPGSGEALLRDQVKSLLQKVDEEVVPSKIFKVYGLGVDSPIPISFLAPTPDNTPQIVDFSCGSDNLPSVTPVTERILIPQMMIEDKNEGVEDEKVITRSLLLDFSEKSISSEVSSCQGHKTDDDNSSIWSIQENASSIIDEWIENEDYYEDEEEEEGEEDDELVNELSHGMNKMIAGDWPKFSWKHIRFVYNSDDEIERKEEAKNSNDFECKKTVLC